jgi:glutamate/tyrosine decarboxylase-like PLP-dependent enzyme
VLLFVCLFLLLLLLLLLPHASPHADQASITLNFSRGAANVVGQYYQLLRLGRDGYTAVMSNLATIARRLADGILETGAGCTTAMQGLLAWLQLSVVSCQQGHAYPA